MTPSLSMNYAAYGAGVNSGHSGDFLLRYSTTRVKLPEVNNLRLSQLAHAASLAPRRVVSLLGNHISNVVANTSEEQVVRIAANAVVALVADAQAFWNWAMLNLPRVSVGASVFVTGRSFVTKVAVAISVFCSNPFPAAGVLVDLKKRYKSYRNHMASACHSSHKSKGGICA